MRDISDTATGAKAGKDAKPLRTATYLLRFTPVEKSELEQKVRRVAAASKAPLSLAEALRAGAAAYLDDLLLKYESSRSDGNTIARDDFKVTKQTPDRESSAA